MQALQSMCRIWPYFPFLLITQKILRLETMLETYLIGVFFFFPLATYHLAAEMKFWLCKTFQNLFLFQFRVTHPPRSFPVYLRKKTQRNGWLEVLQLIISKYIILTTILFCISASPALAGVGVSLPELPQLRGHPQDGLTHRSPRGLLAAKTQLKHWPGYK